MKSFSCAKMQGLEHYVIPHLQEVKPDIVVTHIGSNNVTYNVDMNAALVAENLI